MVLEDKTVIVSGVGAGLGREIALAAVADGANVVMGARKEENLRSVAAEMPADRVAFASTDITDAAQTDALVALAVERFGGVDGLVNCAARDDVMGGLEATSDKDWRGTIEVNLFGTMNMIRSSLDPLRESKGSVVIIGSQTMMKPPAQLVQLAYAASKGALMAASYHLAHELGPQKIRVNTVVPSWMWGPPVEIYCGWIASQKSITIEEARADLAKEIPLRDIASDGDVAQAVMFFLSDSSAMITGQSLLVNAGEYLR